MIQQAGAVPILIKDEEPLILIVNNLNKTRWVVPKGIVESGQTPEETAAREAFEEAGVAGEILGKSLGTYTYHKWNETLKVDLFILLVNKVYDNWAEDCFRKRWWINWNEFMETVDERIPRSILGEIPVRIDFSNYLNKKEKMP
jgi:8-oxo-dGTP pyrophosphatase MutT (NUDIX family)